MYERTLRQMRKAGILSKIGGSRKMPGRKIALNLRGLIFLPHIFRLKPGPVRDTPPRIFETIQKRRVPGGCGSHRTRWMSWTKKL
jgi:hypothetical protein